MRCQVISLPASPPERRILSCELQLTMESNNSLSARLNTHHEAGLFSFAVVAAVSGPQTIRTLQLYYRTLIEQGAGRDVVSIGKDKELLSRVIIDVTRDLLKEGVSIEAVNTHLGESITIFDSLGIEINRFQMAEAEFNTGFDFPQFWDLLRFILGSKNRERIFLPAYNDLLADHLESQLPKYQTPLARRWIQVCFVARTAGLVAQCMAVGLRGAVGAVVVPVAVREAVLKWWHGG